jgi:hypothetical protein
MALKIKKANVIKKKKANVNCAILVLRVAAEFFENYVQLTASFLSSR